MDSVEYIVGEFRGNYMNDIFKILLFIITLIYVIAKNRKIFKELTKSQVFGVVISYLAVIFIAFILIYFGGNWVAGHFSNTIFKYVVFFAVVCISLYLCIILLNKILQKITNSILPLK